MTIKKEGGKFVVRSKAGKKLGSHGSRAKAVKQLGAIETSKKRRGKK